MQRTILRLAFPGGKPRPKPGPYRGDDVDAAPLTRGGSPKASANGSSGNGSGTGSEPAATENAPAERASDADADADA